MLKAAFPLLHVSTSQNALVFYSEQIGFAVRSTYRPDGGNGSAPARLSRGSCSSWRRHLSGLMGAGIAMCVEFFVPRAASMVDITL